jgi:hypothetical protein
MSTNESETRARTMGWLPKEQFKGPEDHWLPADKYLERGDAIMPILQANNKKLADGLSRVESENAQLKASLAAASESIEELKKFRTSLNKEKVQEQKETILAQLKDAKKEGDVDAEVVLTDKLSEVNAALKATTASPTAAPAPSPSPSTPQLTEEAKTWMAANPWFSQDKRKTGFAMGLADEWKAKGNSTGTKEFFDYVDQEMRKTFVSENEERRERPAKVEGGSGGGGGSSKGHSYADLPSEAKAACEKAAGRLVGKDRAYKDITEWRKAYASSYDWS